MHTRRVMLLRSKPACAINIVYRGVSKQQPFGFIYQNVFKHYILYFKQ